jgi:hypothetical protein
VLYLVRPYQALAWSDLPSSLLEVAVEKGADLSNLDWKPAETPNDDVITGLALRHGTACSTGIALDGGAVSLRIRPSELVRSHRDANIAHAALDASQGTLMEHLMPGWRQSTATLNDRVDQSMQKAAGRSPGRTHRSTGRPDQA